VTPEEPMPPHWGETHDGHYLVWCDVHSLHRLVDTEAHARNLYALHMRRDHDDDTNLTAVNVTAAAESLLGEEPYSGQGTALEGALAVWAALTGITDDDEALYYARQIAATTPPLTAVIPPF